MAQHFDPVTLRVFIAVCEEGNIARAAEREALVASAVSKRIAAIEADIGTPLLTRGRRGVVPTAAGQALLRQAREVLSAMARMHAELSEFASGVQGSVRVAAAPAVLAEHLADDIGAFLATYPAVRVSLDERVSPEVVRAVREGSAELGVLWDLTDLSGLHVLRYRGDRLSLVMRDDHPLAGARSLSFEQALEHATIGVAPGGMTDLLLHREAARLGRQLAYRVQVSGMDATARIVAAGLGAAILPREALPPRALESGVVAVPLSDAWAARRIVVCSRDAAGLSATARLLRDHLQRAAAGGDATGGSRSA